MAASSEGPCQKCYKARSIENIPEQKILTIDLPVAIVNKPKKTNVDKVKLSQLEKVNKEKRSEKKDEFISKVSALRNTGGGALLVHINGIDPEDRNLSYFNECFDERLYQLIEDRSLFVENYHKIWFQDYFESYELKQEFAEFVLLTVKASNSVCTYDFKTKITTDDNINRPTTQNILHVLVPDTKHNKRQHDTSSKCRQSATREEELEKLRETELEELSKEELEKRSEDRSKQYKVLHNEYATITEESLEEIVQFIWYKLRLGEYISSFAKVRIGGSFFLGIGEHDKERDSYCTKETFFPGVTIDPKRN